MNESFDLVIVGAGSAGCVLASQLSEDPTRSVLLLEAGPDPAPGELPDELRFLSRSITWPYDWGDEVESLGGRKLTFGRGRGVGGSSATNGGVAFRPEPPDFEAWPAPWDWATILDHLCQIETDVEFGGAPYHGNAGPIPITRWPRDTWSPLHEAFQQAAMGVGVPDCPDGNAPFTTGVGAAPMNRIGRERVSNVAAFLAPVRTRPNLVVRADTHVRRVVVRDHVAHALELSDGTVVDAGEIILSAGVVQDPLLLWRSGIGPADRLVELGVEPVVDNAMVGANLTDHLVVVFAVEVPLSLVDEDAPSIQTILRTTSSRGEANDIQLTPYLRRHPDGRRSLAISIAAQLPRGTGTITPTALDPEVSARIAWPFAGIPENIDILREGWRVAGRIVDAAGIAVDADEVRRAVSLDDEQLDALIIAEHSAFYHGCGTCRMAEPDDAVGVVDPDFTVRGVERLRILDTSVIPMVPRSNTHILVTALAHAAASAMKAGTI